jgi:hypothetical protein
MRAAVVLLFVLVSGWSRAQPKVTNTAVHAAFERLEKSQAAIYKVSRTPMASPEKPGDVEANYVVQRLHRLFVLVKPRFTVKPKPSNPKLVFGKSFSSESRKQLTYLVAQGVIPAKDKLITAPTKFTVDDIGRWAFMVLKRTGELAPEKLPDDVMGR